MKAEAQMEAGVVSGARPETGIDGRVLAAVAVAALGYFVDMFDLVLFNIVRVPSLQALGITSPEMIASMGKRLLDLQLAGMVAGGFFFGALGDRQGRIRTLYGSILLYSAANLGNAFVGGVASYQALRFLAGFGLAGELGAGVTLVSELLPTRWRGLGTTAVATTGILGAVAAGIAGETLSWRAFYLCGGVLGALLLVARLGVGESGIFERSRGAAVSRGNPLLLLWPPRRLARFAAVVLAGMPIWFAASVLFVFAPEIGRALGLKETVVPSRVVLAGYLGVAIGNLLAGLVSQLLQSRTRTIVLFLALLQAAMAAFLLLAPGGGVRLYVLIGIVGAATGYWAVFVTTAGEQFGTNLRATAATSAPNLVRATAIPVLSAWFALRASAGTVPATFALTAICCAVGLVAALALRDTFHRDLDYLES